MGSKSVYFRPTTQLRNVIVNQYIRYLYAGYAGGHCYPLLNSAKPLENLYFYKCQAIEIYIFPMVPARTVQKTPDRLTTKPIKIVIFQHTSQ